MTAPDPRPVLTVLTAADLTQPTQLDRLAERVEIRYAEAADLGRALKGADVLLLWDFLSTAVAGAWSSIDRLDWIHVAAAGVDRLLFDELVESEVVVTNARGVFDRPIAEFVLGSILALGKDLYTSVDHQRSQTWQHRESLLIRDRTVLVVGTGGIGRAIARLLRATGLQVRGAGRTPRDDDPDFGRIVASTDLAREVPGADHVVLVAPLTDDTHEMVDAEVLAAMKPTSQLINVGRGQLVDQSALVAALRDAEIAAAALDVFSTEPLPDDDPLWTTPGVSITPHMSGDVVGWRDTLAEQFVANADRWLNDQPLINQVDKRLGYVPSGSASEDPWRTR